MKLYNPFKPHICQFANGMYAIRRLDFLLGWVYLDQSDNPDYWWYSTKFALEFATKDGPDKLKYPSNLQLKRVKYIRTI